LSATARQTWTVIVVAVAILLLRGGGSPDSQSPPVPPDQTAVTFAGNFVLFVDESGSRLIETADAIGSAEGRASLAKHTEDWAFWDDDTPTNNARAELSELLALGKPKAPCVVLAKGGFARIDSLPILSNELVAMLETWGGQ